MTARLLLEERFQLIGVATSLACYGTNICLLIRLFRTVKQARLWATATTLISFLVVSTFQVLISYITLVGGADQSDRSEGVFTWLGIQRLASSWLVIRTTASIATWIQHAFLFHQCYIIYSPCKRDLWVLGLPVLLLLGSFGSGVYFLVLSTDTGLEGVLHSPLCLSTKLLLVSLIIFKLALHRKRLRENFEDCPEGLTRPYTFLIHVFIQSHALYAGLSLLLLGLYLAKKSAWRMVLPNIAQAGLMSHLLVRLQVMRSRKKSESPGSEMDESSIHFSVVNSRTSNSNSVTDA